ncbi:CASEIN KINASE II SUBUNIT BETA [Salix purpurea]|uniref:Casein kinase II subunit beta n=1 Tax=Salix purpurea TaxID=77065 RepID=A0A9Q0QGC8_SALPP|nr:CASEIN KINASE II SUBUNIT BETA [Salix purpurea]
MSEEYRYMYGIGQDFGLAVLIMTAEVDHRKHRVSDVLDKHLDRSSPSSSRPTNGNDLLLFMNKQQPSDHNNIDHLLSKDNNASDVESETDSEESDDDFNLCGLSTQIPYYDYALDLISDVESSHGDMFTEEQNELVESAAEMLYGLIHARYILTSKGMAAMLDKYKNYDFGRCPRVHCCGQPCLPVGQSDIPRSSNIKICCPRCDDIYYPRSKYQGNIDGAYFGTTFPHLFLMTYGHLKPQKFSNLVEQMEVSVSLSDRD